MYIRKDTKKARETEKKDSSKLLEIFIFSFSNIYTFLNIFFTKHYRMISKYALSQEIPGHSASVWNHKKEKGFIH